MSNNTRSAIDDIRSTLEKMGGQFQAVLPTKAHVDRFIRVVMTAVQQTPDLLEADRTSFYASCMRCAQDGMMPDGKQAVLKIYNQKVGRGDAAEWRKIVQFEPMAEGLMMKLRLSGEIIGAPKVHVVHEADEFTYELGDSERIIHKPALSHRGKIIAAYSIVKLKSGDTSREVMGIEEIDSIMARSKSVDKEGNPTGPWKTDKGEMCRKTVFKRHYKRLPRSSDLDNIINEDNEQHGLAEPIPGTAVAVATPAATQASEAASSRRPAALEAVARAGGTQMPAMPATEQREPVTIEGQAAQAEQAEAGKPPADII